MTFIVQSIIASVTILALIKGQNMLTNMKHEWSLEFIGH
jgi:hypothetical protein